MPLAIRTFLSEKHSGTNVVLITRADCICLERRIDAFTLDRRSFGRLDPSAVCSRMSHPTTPSGSASLPGQPTVATPNPYGALAGRSWADSVHSHLSSPAPGGQPPTTGGAAPPLRFSTPPPSSSAQDQGRKRTRQEFGSPSTVRPDTAAAVPSISSSSAPSRSYAGVVRSSLPPDNSRIPRRPSVVG